LFCFRYDARTLLKAGVGEALKIDKELLEVTHLGPVGSRVLQTEHLWCRGSVHRKPQPHNTTHKPHNKPDNPKTSKPPKPQNPKTPKPLKNEKFTFSFNLPRTKYLIIIE